jgi:hypothetical protein
MKKLIFLATLFLLTSCDALTGGKPKPSVSPTPVTNETSTPTASVAASNETPGPTSSGLPTPSQMPGNSASAPTTSIVNGFPGNNQPPSSLVNKDLNADAANSGKAPVGKKNMPSPSNVMPSSPANPELGLAFGGDQGGNSSAKENGKGTKTKDSQNGQGAKGAKKVDETVNPTPGLPSQNAAPVNKSAAPQTITDGGIGAAKVGMTLAELKKNLKNSARFETQTDFTPGYNALAVKQQGKVQFYIPYPKNKKVTDKDQIKFLVTDNPIYKTAEGVAPGMTIKKATAIYGGAQLAFNPKVKVEEIVAFANQPGDLRFYTSGSESNGRAGIYPKKSKEQGFVTNKFGDSGRIKRITVICPESVCTADRP